MHGSLAGQHLGTLALGIRHVLCTPLRVVRYVEPAAAPAAQRPIGVLYLDSREKGRLLSTATRHALEAFATEAAAAIESARLYRESAEKARLEQEMELAAEIQRALLPQAHSRAATSRSRRPRFPAAPSAETSTTISACRAATSALCSAMSPGRDRRRRC